MDVDKYLTEIFRVACNASYRQEILGYWSQIQVKDEKIKDLQDQEVERKITSQDLTCP